MASLRNHLTTCLENKHFEQFPRESTKLWNGKIDVNKNVRMIKSSCRCGMPDFVDAVFECKNRKCRK